MDILGYAFALLVGLVMGLMGSGGSILCVPIFVYLFGMGSVQATSLSLFVVGMTSLVGSISHIRNRDIQLQNALYFGIPSVISVYLTRKFLVPSLPLDFFQIGSVTITKDIFLMTLFAVLMIFSAQKMIRKNSKIKSTSSNNQVELLIVQGFGVGVITGLIGAGGGFLVVPALVILVGMEMKQAIGTSLCIVALNSLCGFYSSMELVSINWHLLLLFTGISIAGIFLGMLLSKKIDGKKLKPAFGWFVLIIGIFIIFKELVVNQF